jgi:hypothetical protein
VKGLFVRPVVFEERQRKRKKEKRMKRTICCLKVMIYVRGKKRGNEDRNRQVERGRKKAQSGQKDWDGDR